jgi:hypothetical protein
MAKIGFKIIDSEGNPLPNAAIHLVFRGKIAGQGFNTGIIDTKSDKDGNVVADIPFMSDHVNITAISGSFIGEAQIQNLAPYGSDLFFSFNPITSLIVGGIATATPLDITVLTSASGEVKTEGGKTTIVAEYNPVRVIGNKAGNIWKNFSDWLSGNLWKAVVLIILAVTGIYIFKAYGGPIVKAGKKLFSKGKQVVSDRTKQVLY